MRTTKLVEMIKKIGKERLDENGHGRRYRTKTKTHLLPAGRYGANVKLAQEDKDIQVVKTATGGKQMIDLSPKSASLY